MSGKETDRLQWNAIDGGKGDERRPKGMEIVDAGAALTDLARLPRHGANRIGDPVPLGITGLEEVDV